VWGLDGDAGAAAGLEEEMEGVVDLIEMKAIFNHGPKGEEIEETTIPEHLVAKAGAPWQPPTLPDRFGCLAGGLG
jgi:hypothetical protein